MGKCICLLYHSISNAPNYYGISIEPKLFEQHIRYISENYNVQRLEDAKLYDDEVSLIISFDDGYRNNKKYALPVLTEYKVPATFFISSGNVGTSEEFWWDELERLVYASNNDCFRLIDPLYDYTWRIKNEKDKKDLVRDIHYLLRLEPSLLRWHEWRRQLLIWSGAELNGRDENRSMSVDELVELACNPMVTIGGHTVSHRSLGCLSLKNQEYEIESNLKWLRNITGKELEVFSYPFGLGCDYSKDTIKILKESGIKRAVTTERRAIGVDDSPFELPRVSVGNIGVEELSALIAKEFDS